MNKGQLIEQLAGQFDGNKRAAQHALEAVVSTITREVARGEKVAITGFGAFEKAIRPSRMVRNPRTGERTRAKKTAVPKFRPGADLKAVVSGAKKPPKATASNASRNSSSNAASARKSSSTSGTKKTQVAKRSQAAKKSSPAANSAARKSATKKSSAAKKSAAKRAAAKKS